MIHGVMQICDEYIKLALNIPQVGSEIEKILSDLNFISILKQVVNVKSH